MQFFVEGDDGLFDTIISNTNRQSHPSVYGLGQDAYFVAHVGDDRPMNRFYLEEDTQFG